MHDRRVGWVAIGLLLPGIIGCASDGAGTAPTASSSEPEASPETIQPSPPIDGPGPRSAPELVYDVEHAQVLMINGERGIDSADAGRSAVLWGFDGVRWSEVADDGPPGRSLGGVAYDSARDTLVVAGGLVGDTAVSDTWEWDGTSWANRDSSIPGGVSNHLLAVFDAAREQTVIVFGQYADLTLSPATLGWDGTGWLELADVGPPPRAHYPLGYDPVREVVVLFGGYDPAAGRELADTWEWDGAQWTAIDGTGPSARAAARMTYDESVGAMVLFGGATGSSNFLEDTWAWDGASWRQLSETGPSARGYHGMAYDESRSTIVLYGGYDGEDLGDTWEWGDGRWTQVG